MNQTNTESNPIVSQINAAIRALNPASGLFKINLSGIERSILDLTYGEVQLDLLVALEQKLKDLLRSMKEWCQVEGEGSSSISGNQLVAIQESILLIYGMALNCELDTWSGVAHLKVEAPDERCADRVADGLAARLAAHGVSRNILVNKNIVLARVRLLRTLN
jgi:hypothetical protein